MEKLREKPPAEAPAAVPPPANGTNGVHKEDLMLHQPDVHKLKMKRMKFNLDLDSIFWMKFRKGEMFPF